MAAHDAVAQCAASQASSMVTPGIATATAGSVLAMTTEEAVDWGGCRCDDGGSDRRPRTVGSASRRRRTDDNSARRKRQPAIAHSPERRRRQCGFGDPASSCCELDNDDLGGEQR
jgi:hypothetical protein